MARGGSRIGAGRKRGDGKPTKSGIPDDWKLKADLAKAEDGLTPLEFMLAVMRDETVLPKARAAMAIAAAPYVHSKPSETDQSKGQQRKSAAEGVTGKYAAPSPPRLVSKTA